ncbi:hypothetical protein MUP01_08655 [Candidatus Bathyarchaeota archaeon]|nr:hypothetical protein [Candidatus Bathyarchaeota archaeon]
MKTMKTIQTSLNEKEYKHFMQKVRNKGLTPYAYLKKLVLKDLSGV